MENPCEVSWCTAVTTRGRYCAIHARRPVMARERQEEWLSRLRAEDKKAEKEAADAALEEAREAKKTGGSGAAA